MGPPSQRHGVGRTHTHTIHTTGTQFPSHPRPFCFTPCLHGLARAKGKWPAAVTPTSSAVHPEDSSSISGVWCTAVLMWLNTPPDFIQAEQKRKQVVRALGLYKHKAEELGL